MNSSDEYTAPRREIPFADSGRWGAPPVSVSRQVQSWTRGLENASGRQHKVIDEKRPSLPALSAEGIRRDVLAITLALILLVFTGILAADMSALFAGGERIGKLSAGIESLEGSNSLLREELSAALNHPVLRNKAAGTETVNETVVVLSPVP